MEQNLSGHPKCLSLGPKVLLYRVPQGRYFGYESMRESTSLVVHDGQCFAAPGP